MYIKAYMCCHAMELNHLGANASIMSSPNSAGIFLERTAHMVSEQICDYIVGITWIPDCSLINHMSLCLL